MCSLGGKVGGGEGGRGVGGMVVLRGEDARRKAAISEGGAVGERRGRSGAGRAEKYSRLSYGRKHRTRDYSSFRARLWFISMKS